MSYAEKSAAGPGGDDAATTVNCPTLPARAASYCLSDADVLELTAAAIVIASHYKMAMDIEWARSGEGEDGAAGSAGRLFIVQARPETVVSLRRSAVIEECVLALPTPPPAELARGRAVGDRVASGTVWVLQDLQHLESFQAGQVFVAQTTTPDMEVSGSSQKFR